MLIKCKDCFNEVSPDTTRCPHCGAKLRVSIFGRFALISTGIVVAFIAFFSIKVLSEPQHVRNANTNRAICEHNIGKSPIFTQEICDYNYEKSIRERKLSQGSGIAAPRNHQAEAAYAQQKKEQFEELKNTCLARKKIIHKEYLSLIAQDDWWKAGLKVWNCAEATNDVDFLKWAARATEMNEKKK